MPNIRQYVNQEPVFRADDRAQRATETLGYRQLRRAEIEPGILHQATGELQAGIARLQQHMAVTEISQGATAAIGLQNDLTKQWNQLASSTDPNLIGKAAQKFNEEVVTPALDKFGDGFSTDQGKLWATEHVNSLRQHFFEKTAADSSTAAGDALLQNLDSLKNHATDLVQNDPSAMNAALGLVDTSTEALIKNSPDLPADAASKIRTSTVARMKQEIVTAAAAGIAMKNPEGARDFLASNPAVEEHMDADQIRTMERFADTVATHQREQAKADVTARKQADKEAFDGAINQIELSTLRPDGSVRIPKGYFSNLLRAGAMPGASSTTLRAMIAAGKTAVRDEGKGTTDPSVYNHFITQLYSPGPAPLAPADIYKARAAGTLSDTDMKFFLTRVSGKGDPALATAEKQFNKVVGLQKSAFTRSGFGLPPDPQGDQAYALYYQEAHRLFLDAYKRGNWQAALDPANSQFVGKYVGQFGGEQKGGPFPHKLNFGDVVNGFKFLGGDPRQKANWVAVHGSAAAPGPANVKPSAPPLPAAPDITEPFQ